MPDLDSIPCEFEVPDEIFGPKIPKEFQSVIAELDGKIEKLIKEFEVKHKFIIDTVFVDRYIDSPFGFISVSCSGFPSES